METLASGLTGPEPIAVNSKNIYWGDFRAVMKVPIAGGTPTTVAFGQGRPLGLAIDATSVYWTNHRDGTVMKAPLDGGTPTLLASGQDRPWGIAVDRNSVYWTNANSGRGSTLMRVPIDGGTPIRLAAGQGAPMSVVVVGTSVYWTGDVRLTRVPLNGGAATTVSPPGQEVGGDMTADGTSVYCFASPQPSTPAPLQWRGGPAIETVLKVPLDGSSSTILASGLHSPHGIATDGTSIYWTDSGSVMKVPIAGGGPTMLVSNQYLPEGIAVDGTSIYWTTDGGTVMKLTPK